MRKSILFLIAALCAVGVSYGAQQTLNDQDATKVGLPDLVDKVNDNFDEIYAGSVFSNVTLTGNATVAGSITSATLRITSDAAFDDDVSVGTSLTVGANGTFGGAITGASATISGDVDADSYTANAAAGLDVATAGALLLGAADATSVEIADSGYETDIQGTLSVDEWATFDGSVTAASVTVEGRISFTGGMYLAETQLGYLRWYGGHLVPGTPGALNIGSSTQPVWYVYVEETVTAEDFVARNSLNVGTNVDVGGNLVVVGVITGDCAGITNIPAGNMAAGGTFPAVNGSELTALGAANIAANGIYTVGDGSAFTNLDGGNLQDGSVIASKIDSAIVTNVLAGGMVLPAVSGEAVTNIGAANIAPSGIFPASDMGAGTNITGANIVSAIPLSVMTNAAGFAAVSLYSGTYTNGPTGVTNVIVVLNGLVQSATLNP